MTALTRTDIVNLALREITAARVDDYTDDTAEAVIARDLWTQTVRKALARHEWQFAMQVTSLARDASTPSGRYTYRYTLPGDFVRLGLVTSDEAMAQPLDEQDGYVVRGGFIECNAEAVYIDYVYDAPSIGAWPPWFIDVLVADYASVMSAPLKSTTERERLEQLARSRMAEGRGIDSVQQQRQKLRKGGWRNAAQGGWRSG